MRSAACLIAVILAAAACGGEGKSGPEAGPEAASAADPGVYETDRPGEVENPFTVRPGGAELVNYVVGFNAAARSGNEFGDGGSAVILDTAVRFGIADRIEGVLTVDSFLRSNPPEDSSMGSRSGPGYATVLAKWNFLKSATGDFGVALAPFLRMPLDRLAGGSRRPESGLIVPFDVDLEAGWELQGSSSVSRAPGADGSSDTQWENQASLERTLTARLTAYLELQLETGDGPPAWSTEFGATFRMNASILIDVGANAGIGRRSRGRTIYTGLGWVF